MDKRLSNKEVTAIINEIELEFDVNSLTFRGVNFWPFFRIQIIRTLWGSPAPDLTPPSLPSSASFFKSFYLLFLDIKAYFKNKKIVKNMGLLPTRKKTDYIYIAQNGERKEEINNKKIHPFANTLGLYTNERSLEIFEYNYSYGSYYGEYKTIDYLFSKIELKERFFKLFTGKASPKIKNYTAFISFLSTKNIRLNFSEDFFIRKFEYIYQLSKEFESLFSKLNTKTVFFTVYFKQINFAASLACRNLGIKSVEIQHGQQGLYNPQNNGFARVPKDGYELLPSHFWMWGEDTANNKRDLCTSTFHTCIVGGNPWLNSWLNANKFDALINTDIKTDKPQILVALQPLDKPLPDFLLEAMSKTKNDFLWRIRLHPVMKHRQEELSLLLKTMDINFEMEKATNLPLYPILKNCRFTITLWSTIAYEALYFGVKPIIIHENGREIMNDYIEKGIFDYALKTEDLLACLYREPKKEGIDLPSFIETNMEVIKNNLKPILD